MFNSHEILELLQSYPKGYLEPHHDLFKESNLYLFQKYKKLGAISNKEDETLHVSNSGFQNNIFCNVFGCSASFDNTSSYQRHYNAMHRFICEECKKSFPTDHFLDIHISEKHDSYFRARVERGERLFKCYLEECQDVFGSSHERKEHCLNHHKFPSNFRFDEVTHKTCSEKTNSTKKKEPQFKMEVDGHPNSTNNISHKFEFISFGKQKEKTFCHRNDPNKKKNAEKPLGNMNTLKQVLDTI